MFKLSKTMHMMILMTMTVVFVVVYMYYMIRDVRKMYEQVKKHTQEIEELKKSTQTIETNITLLTSTVSSLQSNQSVNNVTLPVFPSPELFMTHQINTGINDTQYRDKIDDDIASVETEDIKKLIDDDVDTIEEGVDKSEHITSDNINDNINENINIQRENDIFESNQEESNDEINKVTEDSLKKMKFDELKEMCRSLGIPTKGTRDTLISKIIEIQKH